MSADKKPAFEVVSLARRKYGMSAVVISHCHPSGVGNVPIRWFKTAEEAQTWVDHNVKMNRLAYEALGLLDMVPYDSYGPIDAVRSLSEWPTLSEDHRKEVLSLVYALIH